MRSNLFAELSMVSPLQETGYMRRVTERIIVRLDLPIALFSAIRRLHCQAVFNTVSSEAGISALPSWTPSLNRSFSSD